LVFDGGRRSRYGRTWQPWHGSRAIILLDFEELGEGN
jgi:hypothetical protein